MKVILHLSQSIMSTSNDGNAINYPISSKYCHIVLFFLFLFLKILITLTHTEREGKILNNTLDDENKTFHPHKNIEDGLKFNPIKLSTVTYSNDCSCNSVGVVAHIFLDLEPDNGHDFYK